ncbi:unnamed protein product [Rotaria socialis]|uniref:Uncharacterized protein n=1 Tax=Rotaria socialis TaxID=392032 RepID=A0A818CEH9_9BILA|nr:unnamed protein product [Rotaria socialis]CAF3429873.1 unnamed protein product [Rotaria socialis]CAF3449027.1 unnamed protein product [Rotaria socialis]CAF3490534.1 unnamed protein product [Rotaria socialis]CAF3503569.1 unnamed protein product [Rotaria socialis]
MSFRPPRYASAGRYPVRGPTFIPKAPAPAGGPGVSSGVLGLIGGLATPILCLGCLATMAVLGLFATMIGAAAYMNGIQSQLRKSIQGAGTTIELNILVLMCALLCSIYVLTKHRRGAAISC